MGLSALVKINQEKNAIAGSDPVEYTYTYSIINDCLLGFILTNAPCNPIRAEVKAGEDTHTITLYGIKTGRIASDEDWKDENHDGVCDDCGRCLYGCSYTDEKSYETLYPKLSFLMEQDSDAFIYYVEDKNGTKEFTYTDKEGKSQTVKYEKTLQMRRVLNKAVDGDNYYDYYIEDTNGTEVIYGTKYTRIAHDVDVEVSKEEPVETQKVLQYLTFKKEGEEKETSYETLYPKLSFLTEQKNDPNAFIYYVEDENGEKEFTYTDENGDAQTVNYKKTLQVRRKLYDTVEVTEGQEPVNCYNYYIEDAQGKTVIDEKNYTRIAYDVGIKVSKEDPATHKLTTEIQTVLQYQTFYDQDPVCEICGVKRSVSAASDCHMNMSSLRAAEGTLSSLQSYLQSYLNNCLVTMTSGSDADKQKVTAEITSLITTEENKSTGDKINQVLKTINEAIDPELAGINADIALLEKLETAKETEAALNAGLESFLTSLGLSTLETDVSLENEDTAKALTDITPEELVGTVEAVEDGVKLNTDGSIYSDMKTVVDTYKAAYDQETKDQDKRLLAYYPSSAEADGYLTTCKEKILSAVNLILKSDGDALETAIASVFKQESVEVEPNNLKTLLTDGIAGKTSAQLRSLLDQANDILSLIAKVETTDEAYFLFLTEEKQSENALKQFLTDCKTAVTDARGKIMTAIEEAYTSAYADKDGVYATRKGTKDDIARGVGNDITVTEDNVEEIIDRLDGFLRSEEFLLLVIDLFGEDAGFGRDMLEPKANPKGDLDGDGKVGLYDFLVHLLVTKVLTDETITSLLKTVFSFLNDFLDNQMDSLITGILKVKGNPVITGSGGHYKLSTGNILKAAGLGVLGGILGYLGTQAQVDIYINGAGGTGKIKDLLSDQLGIHIGSTKFAEILTQNGFSDAGTVLNAYGWVGLYGENDPAGQVLHFGIDSSEDVQKLLALVLTAVGKFSDILFRENNPVSLNLKNLASVNITGTLVGIINVFLDLNVSPELKIDGLGLYNRVIAPLLEALGLDAKSFQSDDISTPAKLAETLWTHLTDLLKVLIKAPVKTILSVIPNLAYYLQNGRFLSILDHKTNFSLSLNNTMMQPEGMKDAAKRIWNHFFEDFWDYLNPFLYASYIAAMAQYTLGIKLISYIADSILGVGVDLHACLNTLGADFELTPEILDGLFEKLAKGIQKLASSLGLYSNYSYNKTQWGNITYHTQIPNDLIQYLNAYAMMKQFLCNDKTTAALGFDLNDPMGILFAVLDSLYYDGAHTQKVFDLTTPKAKMMTANGELSLWKLASLGSLTLQNDGQRAATGALAKGEYFYTKGYAPDVLCYFLEVIACFFGEDNAAQNIKGLLHILGLSDANTGSATLTALHNRLQEKLGFGLDTILGSCVTLKDETVFLNADAIAKKTDFSRNSILCFLSEVFLSPGEYAPTEIVYALYRDEVGGKTPEPTYLSGDDKQNIWTNELAEALADDGFDLVNDLLAAAGLDTDKTTTETDDLYHLIAALPTVLGGSLKDALGLPGEIDLADEQDILTLITALLSKLSGVMQGESLKSIDPVLRTAVGTDLTEWGHDYAWLYEGGSTPTMRYFDSLRAEKVGEDILWKLDGSKVDSYEKLEKALSILLAPIEPLLNLILCDQDLLICQYDGGEKNVVTIGGCDGYNAVLLPLLEALFPQEENFLSAKDMETKGGVAGTVYNLKLILNNLKDIFLKDDQGQIEDLTEMLLQAIYFFSGENGISAMLIDLLQPIWNLYDAMHPMLGIDLNAILNRVIYKLACNFGKFEEGEAEELQKKVDALKIDIRTLSIPSLSAILSLLLSAKLADGEESERVYFCIDTVYKRFLTDISRYSKKYESKSTVGTTHYRLTFEALRTEAEPAMASGNAMTMMVSLLAEGLLAGKNCEILDGVTGYSCFTGLKQMLLGNYKIDYSTVYAWDYPEKSEAKTAYDAIAAEYLEAYEKTDWTDEALEELIANTEDVLNQLLNGSFDGKLLAETIAEAVGVDAELLRSSGESGYTYTLGSVLAGIIKNLLNSYLREESINGLLLFVGDFLNPDVSDSEAAEELQKLGFTKTAALSKDVAAIRQAILEHYDAIAALLGALGIDLDAYRCDGYTVVADEVIFTALSDERSVRLTHAVLAEDYANLGIVLAQVLKPFEQLFQFVLLGTSAKAFYTATDLVDDRAVGDSLISIKGFGIYQYVLLPMMESFGCEELKSDAYYLGSADQLKEFLPDFFTALLGFLTDPILDEDTPVLETLLDALASAVYYINANGVGVSLKNLIAPLEPILGVAQSLMALFTGEDTEASTEEITLMGGLLDDFTLGDIIRTVFTVLTVDENGKLTADVGALLKGLFLEGKRPEELVSDGIRLTLNDTLYTLFDNLSVGGHEVDAEASKVCGFDIQKVTYQDRPAELAKLLTMLTSGILELIEDDQNADFFHAVLGKNSGYYEAVCNLFDLAKFRFTYPDLDWKFTEYADKDTLVSAFRLTEAFRDMEVYGENWTPEMAAELGTNLESFLNDVLYLLGLTVNGTVVRSIEDLTTALVGGSVYSDDVLNSVTGLFGDLAALLSTGYIEGTSKTTAFDYLQTVLGVDLSSWMQYAPGGEYADGRNWGFTASNITPKTLQKNGEIFENALVELLSPIAPLLNILMANRDLSFLLDCDGAGTNKEDIQLTVYGAEGYKYAIIPLYEGLGIAQEEITSPDDYMEKALTDSDYAVRALVHPMISLVNRMAQDTADEALGILPKLIYFINSDGLGTFVKSLGHSLYVTAAALKPALETALGDKLVWEEVDGVLPEQTVQVPDIFATLQRTGLLDKLLEDLLGVTGEDILAIYLKTGVAYDAEVGYRSLDFNLLFSVGMTAVNKILAENGFALDISPLAADLVNELSYGYVRSFKSLTGRDAYTMVPDLDGEESSLGNLVSILMRLVLKFLSEEDNLEAILQFLRLKAGMSDTAYSACKALLTPLFTYLGTAEGMQNAMCLLYYGVYGASTLSGMAVDEYTNLNTAWNRVVAKLCQKGGPLAAIALTALYQIAGDKLGDLVSPAEVAPNGLIPFVTKVVEVVTTVVKSVSKTIGKLFKR